MDIDLSPSFWGEKIKEHYTVRTKEDMLATCLSEMSDDINKAHGTSLAYMATAPLCYELELFYHALIEHVINTNILTATGSYLDIYVAQDNIQRREAQKGEIIGAFSDIDGFPMSMEIGTRFSTAQGESSHVFVVREKEIADGQDTGYYILEAEEAGLVNNVGDGTLLPLSHVNNLGKAYVVRTIYKGSDLETDEELRARYFQSGKDRGQGGNVEHYRKMFLGEEEIGMVQVYPRWEIDADFPTIKPKILGSVKVSLVDKSGYPLSDERKQRLKAKYDPEQFEGTGIGMLPIGHKLTLTSPNLQPVNIKVQLTHSSSVTEQAVKDGVIRVLNNYMDNLALQWGVPDEINHHHLVIRLSSIVGALINANIGVDNIELSEVIINDKNENLELPQTSELQLLPYLSTITMNGDVIWKYNQGE